MSLVGFKARNHPQQVAVSGAKSHVDDLATSLEEFAKLDARFRFTIDVAASLENTKCERFYDIEQDGLTQPWGMERVFCNPPYSRIQPWVGKAWDEWNPENPAQLIVMLLPANRTEQQWWQLLVEPFRDKPRYGFSVEFLPGRMRFIKPGSSAVGPNERPPFGCCLLIWGAAA